MCAYGARIMSVAPIDPSIPDPAHDLESRVENRKRAHLAVIIEHKQSSSRAGSVEAIERARARLSELAHIVKLGVVDGWANVGPVAKLRLDEWIKK